MINTWRAQLALLLAWAVLFALCFPRPNLWPLAHVALVPLTILALRGRPLWRIALLTYIVAGLWVLVMTSWIRPLFPIGFAMMALYMPIYIVGYVLLLPIVHRRFRLPLVLSVPLVWVAIEYLRGAVIFGGFPYFQQGHSQPIVIIQLADFVGVYGVSFLVCMTSGAICDWVNWRFPDQLAQRSGERGGGEEAAGFSENPAHTALLRGDSPAVRSRPLACAGLWLAAIASTLAYGSWRIGQAPGPDAPGIRIIVVQSNVPQSHKMQSTEEQKAAQFAAMLELTGTALRDVQPGRQPQLIVWPETVVSRPLDARSAETFDEWRHYHERLDRFVVEHGVPMLVGGLAVPWGVDGLPPGSWYNSAFLFTPRGIAGRYDKIHRLPFGEYVPLVEHWPAARKFMIRLMPAGRRDYWIARGQDITVFGMPAPQVTPAPAAPRGEERRWSFATPICFEDVITYLPRRMVWQDGQKRVDFLTGISNDGWFANSFQGPLHEQMARFRCVENRVPMARAVNTGVSGFIDSTGRIVARVEREGKHQDITGTATATLRLDERRPPYAIIGDALPIGCVVLLAVMLTASLLPRRGRVL